MFLRSKVFLFEYFRARISLLAGVAQSVEQFIRNEKVEGSIPFTGTKYLSRHFSRGEKNMGKA